jgi:hypothetical protein
MTGKGGTYSGYGRYREEQVSRRSHARSNLASELFSLAFKSELFSLA